MPTLKAISESRAKKEKPLTRLEKRVLKRLERFEDLAEEERAYCARHKRYLCVRDIHDHHCYTGNRGKRACPYFTQMPKY